MDETRECAWCGSDRPAEHVQHSGWCKNRRGEWFCCRSHREASNRALRDFLDSPADYAA